MRYSSRFFLYAPFAGLLLLAAIASVNWWVKAAAMSRQLDAVNGHEIMPGVRLSFSGKALGGFPFRVDTILKNLRVEVAEVTGPVVWTTDDFAMHALAYGRVHSILEAAGHQTLSWHDRRGTVHSFSFLPGTFRASAILQHGKLVRFDGEIVDLDGDGFRAAKAQLHFRVRADAADLYSRLDDARIVGGYAAVLGNELSPLIADSTLEHAGAFDRLLRGKQAPEAALDAWRQAGGGIATKTLSVTSGKKRQAFAGRLTLDDTHDLSGSLLGKGNAALHFDGNRLSRSGFW
jgi:hypothetical protein